MIMRQAYISALIFSLATPMCSIAEASPSTAEKVAFFAEQKEQKEAFNMSILEETDPRAAAESKYNAKAKAERIAFIRSIADLPQSEKSRSLAEYNRAALDSRKDFDKKLTAIPLSKNPKMSDLVKKRRQFDKDRVQKVRDFFTESD
jgi:hypothetical protein